MTEALLQWMSNEKSYAVCRIASFPATLNDHLAQENHLQDVVDSLRWPRFLLFYEHVLYYVTICQCVLVL